MNEIYWHDWPRDLHARRGVPALASQLQYRARGAGRSRLRVGLGTRTLGRGRLGLVVFGDRGGRGLLDLLGVLRRCRRALLEASSGHTGRG